MRNVRIHFGHFKGVALPFMILVSADHLVPRSQKLGISDLIYRHGPRPTARSERPGVPAGCGAGAFATLDLRTRLAWIWIGSPVCGFRPIQAFRGTGRERALVVENHDQPGSPSAFTPEARAEPTREAQDSLVPSTSAGIRASSLRSRPAHQ
jgi:hypothetical protein